MARQEECIELVGMGPSLRHKGRPEGHGRGCTTHPLPWIFWQAGELAPGLLAPGNRSRHQSRVGPETKGPTALVTTVLPQGRLQGRGTNARCTVGPGSEMQPSVQRQRFARRTGPVRPQRDHLAHHLALRKSKWNWRARCPVPPALQRRRERTAFQSEPQYRGQHLVVISCASRTSISRMFFRSQMSRSRRIP